MLDKNKLRTMMADVQSGRIHIDELLDFVEEDNFKRYTRGFTQGARWYRRRMLRELK